MIYENYRNRMTGKLRELAKTYASMIFHKVGELEEPRFLETKEHLRTPPTEGLQPLEKGRVHVWGGELGNMWVEGSFTVPEELTGKRLYAVSRANAVEILFFVNGRPSGIFNSKNADFIGGSHYAELFCSDAKPGERYELAFECYAGHFCAGCHPYENYYKTSANDGEFKRYYSGIDIVTMDDEIKDFVFDLQTVLMLAEKLPTNNFLNGVARNALERVYADIIQEYRDYPFEEIRENLIHCREYLKEPLQKGDCGEYRGYVGLTGHSHMDTAWLWPVSETIRKCARTYANALSLMEQYPNYRFIQSSALHLDWMRRYYPDIFEGIKKRTAEGRYEPNGGVWVECDCNITSGEAMIRQFLKGQRFTRKYLNYTSDCFWLPDTFGYNAAIPQIMHESGVKYFYTQKMSWNDLNTFPYDTFIWRGMDGTEVITHFNIMHTYPDAENIINAVDSIRHKQVFDGKLLAYGFGDGGGGPTYGMLELEERAEGLPALPKAEHISASDFMKKIEREAVNLPVYDGELYLELHRGTLTQMHDIKRNNRLAEIALHNMEFMDSLCGKSKNERSDELWEILLKNQFHDILPGTSITQVNDLARKEVSGVIADAAELTERNADSLLSGDGLTVFNPTSFERSELIYTDADIGESFTDVCGRERSVIYAGNIPAYGAKTLASNEGAELDGDFSYDAEHGRVSSKFVDITLDDNGFISSFVDKTTGRELRREGGEALNRLFIYEDVPQNYDNWDIDADSMLKRHGSVELIERSVVSCGKLELRIRSVFKIGRDSTLTQDMVLNAINPRVDFHTLVDWKERHTLLKVGFDVDVLAPTARHEIQFGYIERPTTRNTSIEAAKYEVCNHKWTDLSSTRYGVALLNDCKYGISVDGSDMCLTLHRAGCHPDVTADAGLHEMTYSLLPHDGSFCADNVVQPAYALNYKLIARRGSLTAPVEPLLTISAPNVICEAVKPSEDDESVIVARLYECERTHTRCKVKLPSYINEVFTANALEEVRERLEIVNGEVELDIKPFKIVTLLLKK